MITICILYILSSLLYVHCFISSLPLITNIAMVIFISGQFYIYFKTLTNICQWMCTFRLMNKENLFVKYIHQCVQQEEAFGGEDYLDVRVYHFVVWETIWSIYVPYFSNCSASEVSTYQKTQHKRWNQSSWHFLLLLNVVFGIYVSGRITIRTLAAKYSGSCEE
jgi:hypothetical protein